MADRPDVDVEPTTSTHRLPPRLTFPYTFARIHRQFCSLKVRADLLLQLPCTQRPFHRLHICRCHVHAYGSWSRLSSENPRGHTRTRRLQNRLRSDINLKPSTSCTSFDKSRRYRFSLCRQQATLAIVCIRCTCGCVGLCNNTFVVAMSNRPRPSGSRHFNMYAQSQKQGGG